MTGTGGDGAAGPKIKMPLNAYMHFVTANRPQVKGEGAPYRGSWAVGATQSGRSTPACLRCSQQPRAGQQGPHRTPGRAVPRPDGRRAQGLPGQPCGCQLPAAELCCTALWGAGCRAVANQRQLLPLQDAAATDKERYAAELEEAGPLAKPAPTKSRQPRTKVCAAAQLQRAGSLACARPSSTRIAAPRCSRHTTFSWTSACRPSRPRTQRCGVCGKKWEAERCSM